MIEELTAQTCDDTIVQFGHQVYKNDDYTRIIDQVVNNPSEIDVAQHKLAFQPFQLTFDLGGLNVSHYTIVNELASEEE